MLKFCDVDIFEFVFVVMWIEDFSDVCVQFNIWCVEGVEDFCMFLCEDVLCVLVCLSWIKIFEVNFKMFELFEVCDLDDLKVNFDKVFWGDMFEIYISEFVQLWEGEMVFFSSVVNYMFFGC